MKFLTGLSNIFGNVYFKKLEKIVSRINNLEITFSKWNDEKLRSQTQLFKIRLKGGENLDDLLPEAYALVREASKRVLKQRHFDVQIMGGIVLHQGKIAEMKTGEGKTLTATLPIYLNALNENGVHVVTVNDYLAKRDTVWMGQIYSFLGMSVGCITSEGAFLYDSGNTGEFSNFQFQISKQAEELIDSPDRKRDVLGGFKIEGSYLKPCDRREAYAADITYGTNNEFGFDYLKDNLVYDQNLMVGRGYAFAIIDEVDSILIDEARTPLIISTQLEIPTNFYSDFANLARRLVENIDYNIDEKMKAVTLTALGISKVENILGIKNLYDINNPAENAKALTYIHHLETALKAKLFFKKDRDYLVKDGNVIIVDEFTGRILPGRRFSDGLHQAIEAKEGVPIQRESRTLASITFQNYFRLYQKLAGMTGTALTSAEEFEKVYKLEVVPIPANKPLIRHDFPDLVYKNEKTKWQAVVNEIKKLYEIGQPVLVGTLSIEKNETLSKMLQKTGIPHEILNAKNHEREGEIIAQAGKFKAVTIATNMAGRGVDIILGGNPQDPKENEVVRSLGGLHVIGTDRHEARRIDNQLRGRSGRQGDPGSSQFFLSLEDDLMRIFGGDSIKNLMERLNVPEDQPIENTFITKAIEAAQSKIEGFNFDARKHILEFDEVLNKHRETIYNLRREFLKSDFIKQKEKIFNIIKEELIKIIKFHTTGDKWNFVEIAENIKALINIDVYPKISEIIEIEKLESFVVGQAKSQYEEKEKHIGFEKFGQIGKQLYLQSIDMFWMNHLGNMDYLRDSVRLRAWGQRDPLVEYKNEGHQMFKQSLAALNSEFVSILFKLELRLNNESESGLLQSTPEIKSKISRNDFCFCGSLKKYKKCHGA